MAYDVSRHSDAGAVEYGKNGCRIWNVDRVLLESRVHVVSGAEAARRPKKTEKIKILPFLMPSKSKPTYLQVAFCMLGTTLLIWTIERPGLVLAPAAAGAVLIGVALRSRKEMHAIKPRMSG